MADTRVTFVTVLAVLLAKAAATTVNITEEWKTDVGWELTCSWSLLMNDSLQSVNLYKNKQLFMIYRPQNYPKQPNGHWNLAGNTLTVECTEAVEKGIKGKCVLIVKPLMEPRRDFTFGCEVSGERPYFRIAEKEILVKALVPPSPAVMEIYKQPREGPYTYNCTSSGLPAPNFVWTVNDLVVPHDFHIHSEWNSTSKLLTSWSSFTLQSGANDVKCTPEVTRGTEVLIGVPATNRAYTRTPFIGTLVLTVLAVLLC